MNRTVEDFIFNIDISLLSFPTSEMRAINFIAKRAQILTARNSIEWRASVLPKRQHSYFPCRSRNGSDTHEIPITSFARRQHMPAASVIPMPLASSVICFVTHLETRLANVDEA